jgi:hypothetical protein
VDRLRAALEKCEAQFGRSAAALAPLLCELACAVIQQSAATRAGAAPAAGSSVAATAVEEVSVAAAAVEEALALGFRAAGCLHERDKETPIVLRGLSELIFLLEAHGEHANATTLAHRRRAAAAVALPDDALRLAAATIDDAQVALRSAARPDPSLPMQRPRLVLRSAVPARRVGDDISRVGDDISRRVVLNPQSIVDDTGVAEFSGVKPIGAQHSVWEKSPEETENESILRVSLMRRVELLGAVGVWSDVAARGRARAEWQQLRVRRHLAMAAKQRALGRHALRALAEADAILRRRDDRSASVGSKADWTLWDGSLSPVTLRLSVLQARALALELLASCEEPTPDLLADRLEDLNEDLNGRAEIHPEIQPEIQLEIQPVILPEVASPQMHPASPPPPLSPSSPCGMRSDSLPARQRAAAASSHYSSPSDPPGDSTGEGSQPEVVVEAASSEDGASFLASAVAALREATSLHRLADSSAAERVFPLGAMADLARRVGTPNEAVSALKSLLHAERERQQLWEVHPDAPDAPLQPSTPAPPPSSPRGTMAHAEAALSSDPWAIRADKLVANELVELLQAEGRPIEALELIFSSLAPCPREATALETIVVRLQASFRARKRAATAIAAAVRGRRDRFDGHEERHAKAADGREEQHAKAADGHEEQEQAANVLQKRSKMRSEARKPQRKPQWPIKLALLNSHIQKFGSSAVASDGSDLAAPSSAVLSSAVLNALQSLASIPPAAPASPPPPLPRVSGSGSTAPSAAASMREEQPHPQHGENEADLVWASLSK